jgi:RNA polymerase primary sigma factor
MSDPNYTLLRNAGLSTRELKVIRMRFGLDDGGEGCTLEVVGQALGVTRERVRQIEAKALRKMKHNPAIQQLRVYIEGES